MRVFAKCPVNQSSFRDVYIKLGSRKNDGVAGKFLPAWKAEQRVVFCLGFGEFGRGLSRTYPCAPADEQDVGHHCRASPAGEGYPRHSMGPAAVHEGEVPRDPATAVQELREYKSAA